MGNFGEVFNLAIWYIKILPIELSAHGPYGGKASDRQIDFTNTNGEPFRQI